MRKQHGFTLIDLMIAVVVVGVLASVAYPAYMDYVRKGRRSAAQAFVIQIADREQQYLLDARTYALGDGALSTLNLTTPPEVSRYYGITVGPEAPTTPPSFTITATPIEGSAQAADGVLTLNQLGNRTRNGHAGW